MDTGSTLGIPVTGESGAELYKYALNSFGQDTSLASEKIAGTFISTNWYWCNNTCCIGTANSSNESDIDIASTVGINTGDFLQSIMK